jgi:hypothetical protein
MSRRRPAARHAGARDCTEILCRVCSRCRLPLSLLQNKKRQTSANQLKMSCFHFCLIAFFNSSLDSATGGKSFLR